MGQDNPGKKNGAFTWLEEKREGKLNRESNMDHERPSKDIYILITSITSHEILG
jgi:hypothetical protein